MATDLINTAMAESSHRQEAVSGVQIPLPFGLKPLNIQLGRDSETKLNFDHDSTTVIPNKEIRRTPELDSETRAVLERTRRICLQESQKNCDTALEEYHRIRYGSSPAADRGLLREAQPRELSTFLQTGLAKWLVPGLDKKLNSLILARLNNSEEDSRETAHHRIRVQLPPRRPVILPRRN